MGLKQAMSALMIDAKLYKGKTQRLTLQGGLSVYLRIKPDEREITLALSRPTCYPSAAEFQTVCTHMGVMYFPPDFNANPETAKTASGMYLVQKWIIPDQVQL
jgi:hypothetical protein